MRTDSPDSSARTVQWLLLDIGGVLELVDDGARPSRFADRWATTLGLTSEQFHDRLARADLPDAARRSGVAEEYWLGIGSALGASADVLAAMREDFWDDYCGTANEELVSSLVGLRGRVGLAILSNSGDGAREEEERRFGFSALFDPICYSHEIGVTKPDPMAFAIALDRMDAEPGGVLFIDDVRENVAAARQAGLRAHLHLDNDGTIRAIEDAVGVAP